MKHHPTLFGLVGVIFSFSQMAWASPPNCAQPEPGPMDFARLTEIIRTCQIKSIDALIPLLPDEYRERYTLVYASQSLQTASPEYPRVISFGKSAKLTLAFNGDPNARGYGSLETAEFDSAQRRFLYRGIRFGGGTPTFTATNPSACTVCHRADPRPNWDSYLLWPGVFGAEDDNMFYKGESDPAKYPAEKALFQRYLPQRTQGRYRFLADFKGLSGSPEPRPHDSEGRLDYFALGRHNLSLTVAYGGLNAQRMVRQLVENPETHPYRYTILAGIGCNRAKFNDDSVAFLDSYVPSRLRARFPIAHKDFVVSRRERASISARARMTRHLSLLGITRPEDPRVIQAFDDPAGAFEGAVSAGLRFLAQGIPGLQMDDWSMEFDAHGSTNDSFNMGRSTLGALGEYYWKVVLDPVADLELYTIMEAAVARGHEIYNVTYRDDAEHLRFCQLLKQKSLDALR